MSTSDHLDEYGDTVLYDVFYEAGTQLNGVLVELQRKASAEGDETAAAAWLQRGIELGRARRLVGGADRVTQIEQIRAWRAQRADLVEKLTSDGRDS